MYRGQGWSSVHSHEAIITELQRGGWRFIGRAQASGPHPPPLAGPHSAPMRRGPASSPGPLQNVMFLLIFAWLDFAIY